MNRFLPAIVLLVIGTAWCPFRASGQQSDFQVWPSASIQVEFVKNLKFHLEEEVRFHENVTQVSRQINDIGLSYRFNTFFKAGLFYRHEADWLNADTYRWRNGFYSELAFRYKPQRFTLGYRLRVQSSKLERGNKESYFFDGFKHRHKFSVLYDIKGIPLAPYLEGEIFINHVKGEGATFSVYRAWAGIHYTLWKQHELVLKYGIDQELHTVDPIRAYIIALGYTFNLEL